MNFGTHIQIIDIDNRKLENVKELKFLGINIDKKVNFGKHVDKPRNFCIPVINTIDIIKTEYKLNKKRLINIYKSLLRLKIDYSFLSLLITSKTNLEKNLNWALKGLLHRKLIFDLLYSIKKCAKMYYTL